MPVPVYPEVVMVADALPSRTAWATASPAAPSLEGGALAGAVAALAAERGQPALRAPLEAGDGADGAGDGAGLLLAAGVGAHVGAPHPYAALALLARAGVRLGRWEVQGYAQGDVAQAALEDDLAYERVWAVDAGIAAGRREPAGFLTVTYGIQLGVSWSQWESPAPPPSGDIVFTESLIVHRVEPRVGASAGVLVPLGSAARLRPSVIFDVAPLDLGQSDDAIGAPVSWASVLLGLSLEIEP